MYNATIYWDLLETTNGPLVCDPNRGDQDYATLCSYVLRVVPSVHALTGLWVFYTVYQYTKLLKWNKLNDPSISRSASRNTRTLAKAKVCEIRSSKWRRAQQQLSRCGENLTHGSQVYLLIGGLCLARSASLVLSGGGTSHPVDEFRGILGDGFCKWSAEHACA
jgi:hypothetical protein